MQIIIAGTEKKKSLVKYNEKENETKKLDGNLMYHCDSTRDSYIQKICHKG